MNKTTIFPPLSDICKYCTIGKRVNNTKKYNCIEGHIPDGNENCKYRSIKLKEKENE